MIDVNTIDAVQTKHFLTLDEMWHGPIRRATNQDHQYANLDTYIVTNRATPPVFQARATPVPLYVHVYTTNYGARMIDVNRTGAVQTKHFFTLDELWHGPVRRASNQALICQPGHVYIVTNRATPPCLLYTSDAADE